MSGVLAAGPTCPVQRQPPDPNCSPRPVEGAVVKAVDEAGQVQARTVSDATGRFQLDLIPGAYTVVAEPVEGYFSSPGPVAVTVSTDTVDVGTLMYDTGMR
ncbi:MAG: carboxypeptidase-like regulatory domain-containing protein [Acidimicrobiia bacterium]